MLLHGNASEEGRFDGSTKDLALLEGQRVSGLSLNTMPYLQSPDTLCILFISASSTSRTGVSF